MASYLQVESLSKTFGDLVLFENLSLSIEQGERVSLIAKNGTGKTTLLNILAGKLDYDSGKISTRRDLRIAYLEQDPQFAEGVTVGDACFRSDNDSVRAIAEYESAVASGDPDLMDHAISRMDSLGAWDYEQRVTEILSRLNIDGLDRIVMTLSGGERKRVALANALICDAELLILDEPTNHLDVEITQWLEEYLAQSAAALLMVTHDRYFLDRVCNRIVEIDNNEVFSYKGNYSYYLEKREERIISAAAQRESDQNLFRKELEWMRRQPQARATKAKARIDAFHELENRLGSARGGDDVRLDVKASYIGTKIFEAVDVCKTFGDKKILDRFNYNFARYEKMGIVGSNGCGKTTFLKILTGELTPDSGIIEIGESVRFGYYSQNGLEFDPSMKVIDVITDIAEYISLGDGRNLSASQFLNYFLFSPQTQHNYVAKLSGGERRRLYLCTILMRNPNFLVLDEPTNDLDIMTLRVLEEYLQSYKGCLIVVSHDRYFMDKVTDHLLVFCGEGKVKDFSGNYSEYLDWKHEYEAAERAATIAASAAEKPKTERSSKDNQSRKLSFKEKQELTDLDRQIPELEAEKAHTEQELNSGKLSIEELTQKSHRISELIEQIDTKTMRWLELSEI